MFFFFNFNTLKLITHESLYLQIFFKTGHPRKIMSGNVFETRYPRKFMFKKYKTFHSFAGPRKFLSAKVSFFKVSKITTYEF